MALKSVFTAVFFHLLWVCLDLLIVALLKANTIRLLKTLMMFESTCFHDVLYSESSAATVCVVVRWGIFDSGVRVGEHTYVTRRLHTWGHWTADVTHSLQGAQCHVCTVMTTARYHHLSHSLHEHAHHGCCAARVLHCPWSEDVCGLQRSRCDRTLTDWFCPLMHWNCEQRGLCTATNGCFPVLIAKHYWRYKSCFLE